MVENHCFHDWFGYGDQTDWPLFAYSQQQQEHTDFRQVEHAIIEECWGPWQQFELSDSFCSQFVFDYYQNWLEDDYYGLHSNPDNGFGLWDDSQDGSEKNNNGSFAFRGSEKVENGLVENMDKGLMENRVVEKANCITRSELSRYFHLPITQAAKELKVGLTLLKKRCREVGIQRWPHRKMKSLNALIETVKELEEREEGEPTLRNTIEKLEEERRLMERMPSMDLEKTTKKLRQACFKANYKRKRLTGLLPIKAPEHHFLVGPSQE